MKCLAVLFFIFQVQCELYEGEPCFSKSDNVKGTCASARRCLSVVNDIKLKKTPQICSYKGNEPIVCCTDCSLFNDTSTVLVGKDDRHYFKVGQKAVDKCTEYLTTLNYNCKMKMGVIRKLSSDETCYIYSVLLPDAELQNVLFSLVKFVPVGGKDALREQYPHMALLGYGDILDDAKWLCGGSVISDRFILTAAHCVNDPRQGPATFVALGVLKRTDPPETWQRYRVKRAVSHPGYKAPSKYHDIALLEVTPKIKFSGSVLPACLEVKYSSEKLRATATGWGALGPHAELANTLQVVELDEFSAEDCSAAYPEHRNLEHGYDHKTQACYGDKEKIVDTCPGDSGGPLQVTSDHGACIFNIIGVTSFGTACGNVGNAGVYAKVQYYVPWIENIVWP